MITFFNPGLVEPLALTTLGVSVKTSDNSIGKFGTGFKYATAVLLRLGLQLRIRSGDETYEFTAVLSTIRGQEFHVVHMNDVPLGFTTDLGKHWDLWMAYRELWSNAKDEGGDTIVGLRPSADGLTLIEVSGSAFAAVHAKRDEFILNTAKRRLLHASDGVETYEGASPTIFYQGLKVGSWVEEGVQGAAFTYNFTQGLTLTEDRSVNSAYYARRRLCRALFWSENEGLLERQLLASARAIESRLDFTDEVYREMELPATFANLARKHAKSIDLNPSILMAVHRAQPYESEVHASLSAAQTKAYAQVEAIAAQLGFIAPKPVIWLESFGGEILGRADINAQEIRLSKKNFELGQRQLLITLIEEIIHVNYGVQDETRRMQELLLHKMVAFGLEAHDLLI